MKIEVEASEFCELKKKAEKADGYLRSELDVCRDRIATISTTNIELVRERDQLRSELRTRAPAGCYRMVEGVTVGTPSSKLVVMTEDKYEALLELRQALDFADQGRVDFISEIDELKEELASYKLGHEGDAEAWKLLLKERDWWRREAENAHDRSDRMIADFTKRADGFRPCAQRTWGDNLSHRATDSGYSLGDD